MGIFARFRQHVNETVQDEVDYIEDLLEEPEIRTQLIAMGIFIFLLLLLRLGSGSRIKALGGEHVLNISALNDANLFKEVFLAYLNASLLEPILAIGGMEKVAGMEVVINLFTLGSIGWWIWLVTDAFDFTDVTQHYRYHVDLRSEMKDDPSKYWWLRLKTPDEDSQVEKSSLSGSVRKDVALWFMLACIGAAWLPGVVTHRDVLHAYVVVFLWIIMHHCCRRATTWSTGYFITFLFPSTALMPLEYCLPLMDAADTVEDLAFVENYRDFIEQRTGVQLTIES